MGDVVKFLKQTKIDALFTEQDTSRVIAGNANDSALSSLKKLLQYKVLSIPLYDDKARAYNAFFDILDALSFIVGAQGSDGSLETLEGNAEFTKYSSKEIANLSGDNYFVPIPIGKPLVEALEVMTHDYPRLHRLPVVDKDGKLIGILSQSRIVRYLGQHVAKFDFGSLSIKQTHLGMQKVIAVNENEKVTKALELIKENKVSAVAIVDSAGVLVGNFSATDLKLLGYGSDVTTVARPDQTLKKFVEKVTKNLGAQKYPISVERLATTASVIKKFTEANVHRIYVVDDEKKPVGVISLVDIIELFVRHILIE
jgi:CBS domain-containing protein